MKSEKKHLIYLAAGLLAAASLPFVITNVYYLHVINLAGIYCLVTVGLNLLSGYTGQVSMGHAGFFAIGTYVSALSALDLGVPWLPGTILAVLSASLCGFVIAVPAMKLAGSYLVLATVGFGEIVRLVLVNWTPVTKGAAGLVGIPLPNIFGIRITSEGEFFYLILVMLILGAGIARRLADSKIGRTFIAIREDELASRAMGVPVDRYKTAAFMISAAFAGAAGSIYGAFSGVTSPDNFTFDDSVAFLCMSVVGGSRTVGGAVVGTVALVSLTELLRAFQAYRLIVYGLILIITVIYMPQGLAGLMFKKHTREESEADS
ncbi:MAG: branched-chain amino acid ABC transporter permease [Synergistaceae bacterium]|jgi:branched-chain amino acid transport system permease protein|nr:branched-chain amino acid ABC transporter permease [Synergistaceae bacterium]